jgi:GntR family transcriptional regulator
VYSITVVLRIDPSSATPVYRQIVDGLRVALVKAEITPGVTLPPVRRLALDLGVHFNTVAQAYRALAQEGWLEISARGGAQVQRRPAPPPQEDAALRRRLDEVMAQLQALGVKPARLARELRRLAGLLEGAS